jgi:hypothetical protein
MASKSVYCFVILSFTKRFPRGNLEVVISLLLILRESLRISIMFVVLFLNGGKQRKLWNMGMAQL